MISDKTLEMLYGNTFDRAKFEERVDKLSTLFEKSFNCSYDNVFSSPGRIEICGNHTDHNHGKVVVGAIDCDMLLLSKKSDTIRLISEGFDEIEINPDELEYNEDEKGSSKALVKGVLKGFKDRGYNVGGFIGVMNSTVFNGAGVSSSAAYELLMCQVQNHYYNDGKLDAVTLAKIGQFSENVYFGKPSGLLDQSGIALGGISAIDFKDPESPTVKSLGRSLGDLSIVLVNTGSHANLTADYAAIRNEMEEVAKCFGKSVLRDVDKKDFLDALPMLRSKVSGRAILRAMHFFNENDRVDELEAAIRRNDVDAIKDVINRSGASSADLLQNYFVAGDVDQGIALAVNVAKELESDIASRVHGGGFAGTAIVFAEKEKADRLIAEFKKIFGEENVFNASVRMLGACKVL